MCGSIGMAAFRTRLQPLDIDMCLTLVVCQEGVVPQGLQVTGGVVLKTFRFNVAPLVIIEM